MLATVTAVGVGLPKSVGESLKTNLFTPDQMELVRQRMPDLESLLPMPK